MVELASKGIVSTFPNQNPQMLSFCSKGNFALSIARIFRCIRKGICCSYILAESIHRWFNRQHACVFKNKGSTDKKANNPKIRITWSFNLGVVDEYHQSSPTAPS